MGDEPQDDLTLLADWMRRQGIRRARYREMELEFSKDPAPIGEAKERRAATDEERRTAAIETKRRAYERELGQKLTDDQLRQLP